MFAFRLAAKLGYADVDAMLDSIPSSLLTEWMAFYGLENWSEERADLRAGGIAAAIYNTHARRAVCRGRDFVLVQQPRRPRSRRAMIDAWKSFGGVGHARNK